MKPAETKRPSIQFYPGDWRRDLALRTCTIGARGLLIELMCVMHDGDPYGHLAVAGVGLSDEEASAAVGISTTEYRRYVRELLQKRVLSQNTDNMIYSRRMVRDEVRRNAAAAGGAQSNSPTESTPKGRNGGTGQLYNFLLLRFGGCLYCGATNSLELHRIIPGRKHGKYEPGNLLLLCREHHIEIEHGEISVRDVMARCGVDTLVDLFEGFENHKFTKSVLKSAVPKPTPSSIPSAIPSDTPDQIPSSTAVASASASNPLPPPGGGGGSPVPPPPNSGEAPAPAEQPSAQSGVSKVVPKAHLESALQDPVVIQQGITNPEMLARRAEFAASLDAAVANVPHEGARSAIRRLLDEQRTPPDRWPRLVARMAGWQQGLGTSGMRPVSWEAIDEGIHELLDADDGQKITPQIVLIFVEKAERRRCANGVTSSTTELPKTLPPGMDAAQVGEAIRYARKGAAEWIELCQKHGIDYSLPTPTEVTA